MTKPKSIKKIQHIPAPPEVIWRFIRKGLSVRVIAAELHKLGFTDSKTTVQRRIAKLKRQSCIVSNLLNKKRKLLDERVERRIRDWVRTEGVQGKMQVYRRLRSIGYPVSYRTVCRTLAGMKFIKFGYPSQKVYMTAQHRRLRLEWAREQLQAPFDWTKVFFADEKQWKLDGPVGRRKVLYDRRDGRPTVARREPRNDSIQVWGAFSLTSVPPLASVSVHFNAREYISVLAARFLAYARSPVPVLLHDRHPAHTAKLVEKWLDALGIVLIKLPAKSPDLNPIENVWSMVSRHVYHGTTTYNNQESLLDAIRAAWETVRADHTLRQHLVDSMTRRFQAVVRAKGGPTKF
jgi:hypothetical protein